MAISAALPGGRPYRPRVIVGTGWRGRRRRRSLFIQIASCDLAVRQCVEAQDPFGCTIVNQHINSADAVLEVLRSLLFQVVIENRSATVESTAVMGRLIEPADPDRHLQVSGPMGTHGPA